MYSGMEKRMLFKVLLILAVVVSFGTVMAEEEDMTGVLRIEPDGVPGPHVLFWLESSLKRVYPGSEPGSNEPLNLITARNRSISFQACLRNNRAQPLGVVCSVTGADGLDIQIRRVGYVPMEHLTTDTDASELEGVGHVPGFVPDPLFPETAATVGPYENQSFWITIKTTPDTKPGQRYLTVEYSFHDGTQKAQLEAKVDVRSLVVQPRKDFQVTHWWRLLSIYEHHKIDMFSDRCWELTEAYLKNLIEHGNNVIFTPSWFCRSEVVTRPSSLLLITRTGDGRYEFDWTHVRRFLNLAKECGAEYFEWPHLWIYWGVEKAMPMYTLKDDGTWELLWPVTTGAFSDTYVDFLKQFLPEFHRFLIEEDVLETSYFHLSDEPSGDRSYANYTKARELLKEIAPWMKVLDALSEVRYGKTGLTDYPVPDISAAQGYINEKIPHWVYYCCGPRGPYLNRFMDTPLVKVRMSGWLFYKLRAQGFLHWGYNCYHVIDQDLVIDPFLESDSRLWPGIPHGDPFVVYPGPDGPLDSIRWEVFWESLQDYAMLQSAGIDPDDPLLEPIKNYADFPKMEQWIEEAIGKVLAE